MQSLLVKSKFRDFYANRKIVFDINNCFKKLNKFIMIFSILFDNDKLKLCGRTSHPPAETPSQGNPGAPTVLPRE
jgi:hypothetical protein